MKFAIKNTQNMMSDYLDNRGAAHTDIHYMNLEKILGIFQSVNIVNTQDFQNTSVVIEDKTEVLSMCTEGLSMSEIDSSIEWINTLILDYKKSGGEESSVQYQVYMTIVNMLQKIKKDK